MRSKTFILGIGLVLVLLIVLIFVALLTGDDTENNGIQTPDAFEPFGSGAGERELGEGSGEVGDFQGAGTESRKFRRLSAAPVAGATFVEKEGIWFARWVDRASGHVLETRLDTIAPIEKISNTTIPQALDASWGNENRVVITYLDQYVQTPFRFVATLTPSATSTEEVVGETEQMPYFLDGFFLPTETTTHAFSPDGAALGYAVKTPRGSELFVYRSEEEENTRVGDMPLQELSLSWLGERLFLTTRAAQGKPGHSMAVSTVSGSPEYFAVDTPGLTALPHPLGQAIWYFYTDADGYLSRVFSIETNEVSIPPFVSLSEKCVWGGEGNATRLYCAVPRLLPANLPDRWYQGALYFEDEFRSFAIDTYTVESLGFPTVDVGLPIDAIKLTVSSNARWLLFINKPTGYLWAIDLAR